MNYDFNQFENDVKAEFLKNYPDYAELYKNTENPCICDNGDVILGNMQFKTDLNINDYEV